MEVTFTMPQKVKVKRDKDEWVLVAARPSRMRDSLDFLLKSVFGINNIVHADDSPAALRLVSEHRPALLLLDTNLPGEGFAIVLHQIKSDGSQSHHCLVLADDDQRQQQALAAGADAALVKGFSTAELFEIIDRLLSD